MRDEINLTDEEIEASFDEVGYSTDIDSIAFTRETLDDFRAAREQWAEAGCVTDDTDTVFAVDRAQTAKGQPRAPVVVIDFGAVRAISRI